MPRLFTLKAAAGMLMATLCLVSTTAPAASQRAAAADPLSSISTPERNYVCGELLVGLAIAGLRDYARSGGVLPQNDSSVDPNLAQIYVTGAASILMFQQAKGLGEAEREDAHEVTAGLVQGPAKAHIQAAISCRQTVEQWLDTGEIVEQAYEQALLEARNTLPEISDSLEGPQGLLGSPVPSQAEKLTK